jgi:uncharacterized membrane protein (DUF106 family)
MPKYPLSDRRKPFLVIFVVGILAGVIISFVVAFFTYPSGKEQSMEKE